MDDVVAQFRREVIEPRAVEGDEPPPPPLVIVEPRRLASVPAPLRRWMVDEWMPWRTTTALYGDGGVGKTLSAQMLGAAAATGLPWLGLKVAHCRALGIFCEDDEDELHRRQESINATMGIGFDDLADFRWISRVGHDNLLMTFKRSGVGELRPFWHQVREAALDLKSQLVILDTAADLFGGNENDRGQVRQFIQGACTRLAIDIDGAVLLCAHPSRSGLQSGEGDGGNTAWNNSVRSRWYLSRPKTEEGETPDTNARLLTRKKANYAARDDEVRVRWEAGAFVAEHADSGIVGTIKRKAAERVFLELLDAMTAADRPVSDNARAGNYAPRVFASRPDREGYKKADFAHAMEALFARQEIKVVEYGRTGDQRRKLARAVTVETPEMAP